MDKSFKVVVNTYKPIAQLTHKQEVQRLYRKCLRNLQHWVESREVYNEEARKIRDEFNMNMKEPVGQ